MNAADIMSKAVVTIPPNAPITEAVRLMLDQRISGLPVVDAGGQVVGILTEADLLRRAETGTDRHRSSWLDCLRGGGRQAREYVQSHGRKVDELMTRNVVTAEASTPLADIVELMQGKHIKRVPILSDGLLVGVVSRADLLRALAQELEKLDHTNQADPIISRQIETELGRHHWSFGSRISPVVVDGDVFLEGVIFDEHERDAIRVAAENVTGVKQVHDHMQYIGPNIAYAYGIS